MAALFVSFDQVGDRLALECGINSENAMALFHLYLFITVDGKWAVISDIWNIITMLFSGYVVHSNVIL